MKKYMHIITIISIITIITILIFCSCEKNIFGPNKGSLEGTVTDNNGTPVKGAKITAKHIQASDDLREITVNINTDDKGFYRFEKLLLTEQEIIVEKHGLDSYSQFILLSQDNTSKTLDVSLVGSPSITNTSLSQSTISIANKDTTTINITVVDLFNENPENINYDVKCLLFNGSSIETILTLPLISNSNSLFLFKTTLIANELPAANYNTTFEVTDPDGQTTSLSVGSLIVTN